MTHQEFAESARREARQAARALRRFARSLDAPASGEFPRSLLDLEDQKALEAAAAVRLFLIHIRDTFGACEQ